MTRACIVTIDAARARIFLYNGQAKPGFELVEYKDLDNPGRRLHAQEIFSETDAPGGPAEDRDSNIELTDTQFAKLAFETLEVVLREKQIAHLIVCAAPRMMGMVRAEGDSVLRRAELRVDEITSNLSTLTEAALHDHLAQHGFIPARARLAMAR